MKFVEERGASYAGIANERFSDFKVSVSAINIEHKQKTEVEKEARANPLSPKFARKTGRNNNA